MTLPPETIIDSLVKLDGDVAIQTILQVLKDRPNLSPAVIAYACPVLTYAPARAMSERRSQGILKSFSAEAGHGWIACPEMELIFGCDVSVKTAQVGTYEVGAELSFAICLDESMMPEAYDLRLASGLPAVKVQPQPMSPAKKAGPPKTPQVVAPPPKAAGDAPPAKGKGKVGPPATCPTCREILQKEQNELAECQGCKSIGCWYTCATCQKQVCEDCKVVGRVVPPKVPLNAGRVGQSELPAVGTYTGKIATINEAGRFGFVTSEELQAKGITGDLWFHLAGLPTLEVGMAVQFTAYEAPGGQIRARDIVTI